MLLSRAHSLCWGTGAPTAKGDACGAWWAQVPLRCQETTLAFRPAHTLLCQGLPRGKSLQLCGPSPAKHMQVVVGPPLEGLAQCLAADWARSWGPPSHLPELLSRERGREGSPGAPPRKPLGLTPSEGCPAGTATDLTATRLPRARAVWLRFRARLCSSADAAVAPAATFRRVSAWGRVRACARARAFRGSVCCC